MHLHFLLFLLLLGNVIFITHSSSTLCQNSSLSSIALQQATKSARNILKPNHKLILQILFTEHIPNQPMELLMRDESSRIRWLDCCLKKLQEYSHFGDIVVWYLDNNLLKLSHNFGNITFLELPKYSWILPCNISDNSTWSGRHMFDIDYYIMGRWRLTFAFEFAKEMGYKYNMQYDDDSILLNPITYDIVEKMDHSGFKHAVLSNSQGAEYKY